MVVRNGRVPRRARLANWAARGIVPHRNGREIHVWPTLILIMVVRYFLLALVRTPAVPFGLRKPHSRNVTSIHALILATVCWGLP